MTKNNAAPIRRKRQPRASQISTAATGRSEYLPLPRRCSYQSEAKNPAYAPAVHELDKWTAEMAA